MNDLENLSFEEAFGELERIVQQLEEGDLQLEQAIRLYELGMQLAQHCNNALDGAELRIQELGPRTG